MIISAFPTAGDGGTGGSEGGGYEPIGTIKYIASQNVGPEWLHCDGSFINEKDYPELVATLGKLTPSNDKFNLISDGEIGTKLSNGAIYAGKMWVYSYSTKKLYGVDLEGKLPIKTVTLTSTDSHFSDFIEPTIQRPLVLSIVPHKIGNGARLFLTQIISDGGSKNDLSNYSWLKYFLLYSSEFSADDLSLEMNVPFTEFKSEADSLHSGNYLYTYYNSSFCIPQVISRIEEGMEMYYCAVGQRFSTYGGTNRFSTIAWDGKNTTANFVSVFSKPSTTLVTEFQRMSFSHKNRSEIVYVSIDKRSSYNASAYYKTASSFSGTFSHSGGAYAGSLTGRVSSGPLNVVGRRRVLSSYDINMFLQVSLDSVSAKNVVPNLPLPNAARTFVDAGAYLWGKDMFFIFVGTGIIFSRDFEPGSFGYLDTTSVLGTITQYGYLDYSEDENTIYILGQDSTNKVKVAKMVLNTLYDYANDGAWLPMLASDGVPAYIKAKEPVVAT